MTTAQLEAAIEDGHKDPAIRLRLSEIYLLYGTDTQKTKAFEYLMPMAEKGMLEAAERMCPFVYIDEYKDAAIPYCVAAARTGSMRAQADVCIAVGPSIAEDINEFCEEPAKAGRADTYIYYASKLVAENRFEDAVKWINKAIYEGPLEHRDMAVYVMLFEIKDNVADNPYHDANVKARGMGYVYPFEVVAMPKPLTPTAIKKSEQCYVKFTVTPEGFAYNTDIKCSHASLDKPMAQAVHKWRFKPSTWRSSTSLDEAEYIPIFDREDASRLVQFDPR